MAILYPVYQVLFNAVTGAQNEIPALLLLPIMKLGTKNFLSCTISHMEDMLPQTVIFTVDFFNSFYLATCMQSASSLTSVLTAMAVDFAQAALDARRQYQQVTAIITRLQDVVNPTRRNETLLALLRSLYNDLEKSKHSFVRVSRYIHVYPMDSHPRRDIY